MHYISHIIYWNKWINTTTKKGQTGVFKWLANCHTNALIYCRWMRANGINQFLHFISLCAGVACHLWAAFATKRRAVHPVSLIDLVQMQSMNWWRCAQRWCASDTWRASPQRHSWRGYSVRQLWWPRDMICLTLEVVLVDPKDRKISSFL